MIWDKKIVVTIVPSLGVVAFLSASSSTFLLLRVSNDVTVTGIGAIRAFATDTTDTVFTGRTRTWVSAMLCLTLFTKLTCLGAFTPGLLRNTWLIAHLLATVLAGTLFPRPLSSWHSVYLRVTHHPNLYKVPLLSSR